MDVLLL
jgi:hypothetical protein